MFIVICHWYGGCEAEVFLSHAEAYDFMRKDFVSTLKDYEITCNDAIPKFDTKYTDKNGNCVIGEVGINHRSAWINIDVLCYEDRPFWEIIEKKITID